MPYADRPSYGLLKWKGCVVLPWTSTASKLAMT